MQNWKTAFIQTFYFLLQDCKRRTSGIDYQDIPLCSMWTSAIVDIVSDMIFTSKSNIQSESSVANKDSIISTTREAAL